MGDSLEVFALGSAVSEALAQVQQQQQQQEEDEAKQKENVGDVGGDEVGGKKMSSKRKQMAAAAEQARNVELHDAVSAQLAGIVPKGNTSVGGGGDGGGGGGGAPHQATVITASTSGSVRGGMHTPTPQHSPDASDAEESGSMDSPDSRRRERRLYARDGHGRSSPDMGLTLQQRRANRPLSATKRLSLSTSSMGSNASSGGGMPQSAQSPRTRRSIGSPSPLSPQRPLSRSGGSLAPRSSSDNFILSASASAHSTPPFAPVRDEEHPHHGGRGTGSNRASPLTLPPVNNTPVLPPIKK